jgi:hypothetical protein
MSTVRAEREAPLMDDAVRGESFSRSGSGQGAPDLVSQARLGGQQLRVATGIGIMTWH